ncbi:Type I inositol-3:4-bisphosphate 4-phosphatase-like protein [Leptotrombidium deliense]|uniref:Type I inositol-3:4-bisphosphate 4-phosphatase-like protein n=1 Tax=Leptotrombidium deliense TaxID=299467 RepID=A0A443S8X5_9ACAR|nr:Type I inositol-3:4-bisphosphate 4-phosphatase-like protein [Leptotrombidium deliense]
MLVNREEIARLALLDSVHYEKEGFLFVRERNDGLLSRRNDAFIERLCRLKGNLLFVLNTNTNPAESDVYWSTLPSLPVCAAERSIVYVLLLEEYTIRLLDESNDKHFCFIIDFGKNETLKPFFFASISQHERDSWVEAIHLSSFTYLKLIQKSFLQFKPSIEESSIENETAITDKSVVFIIACNLVIYGHDSFEPNLYVNVYKRDNKLNVWQLIGKTEVVNSKKASFAKQFHFLPADDENYYNLKFKVFDVIERITETRMFLGEAVFLTSDSNKVTNAQQKSNTSFYNLDIISSLRDTQVIGKLQLSIREKKSSIKQTMNGNGKRTSFIQRPQTLSVDSLRKVVDNLEDRNGCVGDNVVVKDSYLSTFKLINCSVPNSLHPDNSPLTPRQRQQSCLPLWLC